MTTQCLASTGSNLLAVLGIGFVLAVIGFFLLRSAKGRAAVMVLVLVGGGLLVSQATSKPASAACVASSATTMPAPTTSSTPSTTSSTTTTTTTPTADFTFSFTFGGAGITDWNNYACSGFQAFFKVTGASGPGVELVNANSSFPSNSFQSESVPVTANTSYTVTYSWSCDPLMPGYEFFETYASLAGVSFGDFSYVSGNFSQPVTFSTGSDVSAPIVLGLAYQGQSPN
jgi:hypothetical protein